MKILIVNAGSSSLKYQLLDMDNENIMAKGSVERIGLRGSNLTQRSTGKIELAYLAPDADKIAADKLESDAIVECSEKISTHVIACQLMLNALVESHAIASMGEIDAVGHRVLHGGEEFTESCIIAEEVKAAIRKYIPLGPLHNPANLMGIEACEAVMPNTPQVAVFDTMFHLTIPPKAFMYGLPYAYYEKHHVRRYGFHGTSHSYVSKRVCEFLGIDPMGKKIIVCHLGNGSSLSAVVDGKCVDTSMGLTPLEGLLIGTRCGSCDPTVVQFIANNNHMTPDQVLNMMNKESGLYGIVGEKTGDMRDINRLADGGHERAALARDMVYYQLKKLIGAYIAAMNGVDVICFTAGIGENDPKLREDVMKDFSWLGIEIDAEKNNCCGREIVISTPGSKVTVCVIPTNEELCIARETLHLIQ